MSLSKDQLHAYADYYQKHLVQEVMPFWESRTADVEYGGYFTCFNRRGDLTSTDKYIWCQARQVWMFSALCRHIEKRPDWLELARIGRDFLAEHAHAGEGRWYYQLDRQGRVIQPNLSILTDAFAIMGLCEYAGASGSDQDLPLIRQAFDRYERNFHDPGFKEYYHFVYNPRYLYHGPHMLSVNVASVVAQVLGQERTRSLMDFCLEKVLHVFAKDEHQILFEMLARDGGLVDAPEGRTINPGHALESMWFCMHEARARHDHAASDRCVQVCDWFVEKGFDRDHGGILAFVDPAGNEPYVPQLVKDFGEDWDAKIWWVHSEALYTLALAAHLGQRGDLWTRFDTLHDYCRQHFFDPEYGEWYKYLHRDGTVSVADKGSRIKSAFHIPRALMYLVLLFQEMQDDSDR